MEIVVGMLIIAFFIGTLVLAGLKKVVPEFYKELFFLLVMIVVNIFTGFLAYIMAAIAVQTGGSAGSWLVFIAVEGIPFLLFILSFILLVRKL